MMSIFLKIENNQTKHSNNINEFRKFISKKKINFKKRFKRVKKNHYFQQKRELFTLRIRNNKFHNENSQNIVIKTSIITFTISFIIETLIITLAISPLTKIFIIKIKAIHLKKLKLY